MHRRLALLLLAIAALSTPLLAASPRFDVRPLDPSWKGVPRADAAAGARRTCGTPDLPPELARAIDRDAEPYLRAAEGELARRGASPPRTVEVAVLVIHDGNDGFLTVDDIKNQIAVLNLAYSSYKVTFVLAAAFEVDAPRLFRYTQGSAAELQAKSLLAQKGYDAARYLRIYTLDLPNLLGFATFPWDVGRRPQLDGVSIHYSSFPFGQPPYDLGYTTVHEVGHWLGLYHPFQGGCRGAGDLVADTPPEASPAFGCPLNRDSCRGGGRDDIRNFMDYSDDACMNHFTNGQATRMLAMTAKYRRDSVR